jgi:hypothetical protein
MAVDTPRALPRTRGRDRRHVPRVRVAVRRLRRAESPERWLHDYNNHRPHLAHAGRPPIAALNNVPSTPSPYGLPLIRIDLGRSANRFDEEVHVGSKSLHPIAASKEAELGGARCRRGDSTGSSPWS